MPATREITIGAPSTMPSCHRIFWVRDQGLFPQKVQPEGLWGEWGWPNGSCAEAGRPAQPTPALGGDPWANW